MTLVAVLENNWLIRLLHDTGAPENIEATPMLVPWDPYRVDVLNPCADGGVPFAVAAGCGEGWNGHVHGGCCDCGTGLWVLHIICRGVGVQHTRLCSSVGFPCDDRVARHPAPLETTLPTTTEIHHLHC